MSTRLAFLIFPYGGVCFFKPLPKLAAIIEKDADYKMELAAHSSMISEWGEQQLGLQAGALQAKLDFYERVEVPNGDVVIYLPGFQGDKVITDSFAHTGARFVSLMECIGIPTVDMLLLREAYRVIMGG